MNFVDQLLAWFRAPAGTARPEGRGWLDWFAVLSRGWKTDSRPPSSAPTGVDISNDLTTGQVLVAWLDQLASGK